MNNKMKQLFEEHSSPHVLYTYDNSADYIDQVVGYVLAGIQAKDYVVLIENDRAYSLILNQLAGKATDKDLEYVHRVNNFDFYYSSGSYHPPAIVDYFNNTIQGYVEQKIPFRAWAHVEWASSQEPLHLIEDLETVVDGAVNELKFPLVCAYEGYRMPDYLKDVLMKTHPYVLLENDIIISNDYHAPAVIK